MCVCDATGIFKGRKHNKTGTRSPRDSYIERSSAMTFENMMCRLDIPPLPLISFDFAYLPLSRSSLRIFSLSSSLQVENIKPFSYFPFVFSSIVPIFTRSPPSMRNCPFPNDMLCYTHVARSAAIVSFFFNLKRYLLNTRQRVPS